jgi:hypothetical protein
VDEQVIGSDEEQRRRRWQWVVLAIVLVVVLWLLWTFWDRREAGPGLADPDLQPGREALVDELPGPARIPEVFEVELDRDQLVPDLVGWNADDAERSLEAIGYRVAIIEAYDDEIPKGKVVSVSPAPGTRARVGSVVTITVSLGPELREAIVPDVVGMTEAQASSAIKSVGLRPWVIKQHGPVANNIVFQQSPDPGVVLLEGSRVDILVSIDR